MSQNRFALSLEMFLVCDNEEPVNPHDRLHKISTFLNILQNKFQHSYTPEEIVYTGESNIPFCGRLLFMQYIPNKRNRYGIKMFLGYALLEVIHGHLKFKLAMKNQVTQVFLKKKWIMLAELMDGLFGNGRSLHRLLVY